MLFWIFHQSRGRMSSWPIVLTLLSVIPMLADCVSLPHDVQRRPSFALGVEVDTALRRDIKPLVDAHPGASGFHVLIDGADAYAARLVLVKAARRTLDLQYYIWHDDLTGRVLYNRLLEAADRGVRVRILLDDLDVAGKDEMLHLIDAHPNIEIRLFNPFASRGVRIGEYLGDTRRINHRMHNKTFTADNQATIVGGRNIGDEYFGASQEVGFSDLDVLAIGPVASKVSQAFDLFWNSRWVYPLSAFEPKHPVTDGRIRAFRMKSNTYLEEAETSAYAVANRALKMAHVTGVGDMDWVWGRWALIYDQPDKVEADQVKADTHLAPRIKEAMDATRNELLVVSPYFVPGTRFTEYLAGLVRRGVRVRIMTNSLAANDVSLVHAGYMRYRKALIKSGVGLYEYKRKKGVLPKRGTNPRVKGGWTGSSRASLHGKYFGFDRRFVFIGSFNLDARSVALNTELGAYIESPEFAQMLSDGFDHYAMVAGYRVALDQEDNIVWITLEDGREVRFDHEPEAGLWKRFSTHFLSVFVPESQL